MVNFNLSLIFLLLAGACAGVASSLSGSNTPFVLRLFFIFLPLVKNATYF